MLAIALSINWILDGSDKDAASIPRNEPDLYMLNASIDQYDDEGRLNHRIQAERFTHFPLTDLTSMQSPVMELAGSLLETAEGSLQAEGSLPKAAEGSLPKAAEGSLPKAAEGSLQKAAEGSLQKAAEGSLLETAEGSWRITADEGRILPASRYREEVVELWTDVVAARRARPGRFVRMESESLTVYTERAYMETDAKITLASENGSTTAAGMQAFLDVDRFLFFSDDAVRIHTTLLPSTD